MAVDYTTLFEDIGKFVKVVDVLHASAVGDQSGNITYATVADPMVITSVGHGLINSDLIVLRNVRGMAEINDRRFEVASATPDTFEVNDEDGNPENSLAHSAYTGGGEWSKIHGPRPDYVYLLEDLFEILHNDHGHERITEGIDSNVETFRDALAGQAGQVAQYVTTRLLDRLTVLNELANADGTIESVLVELFRDMNLQTQHVERSTVTVGTPAANSDNSGNGTLHCTKVLDGVAAPSAGWISNPLYKSVDSELTVPSDTIQVTCIADEDTDGLPEGAELFRIRGEEPYTTRFDYKTEGSGVDQQLTVAQGSDILSNGNFEAFNVNTPEGWTVENGDLGSNVVAESTAANVHRGDSALKLDGGAGGVGADLYQDLPPNILLPNRQYFFAVYYKTASITTADLTIQIESPSGEYTAGASEKINLNTAALQAASSYTLGTFWVMMPAKLPEDLRMYIRYNATNAGELLYLDSMGIVPVVYAGGIGYALVAGSDQFVRGDRFAVTHTNSEGVFQRFFRRMYQFQLPSNASPSQEDYLAY